MMYCWTWLLHNFRSLVGFCKSVATDRHADRQKQTDRRADTLFLNQGLNIFELYRTLIIPLKKQRHCEKHMSAKKKTEYSQRSNQLRTTWRHSRIDILMFSSGPTVLSGHRGRKAPIRLAHKGTMILPMPALPTCSPWGWYSRRVSGHQGSNDWYKLFHNGTPLQP